LYKERVEVDGQVKWWWQEAEWGVGLELEAGQVCWWHFGRKAAADGGRGPWVWKAGDGFGGANPHGDPRPVRLWRRTGGVWRMAGDGGEVRLEVVAEEEEEEAVEVEVLLGIEMAVVRVERARVRRAMASWRVQTRPHALLRLVCMRWHFIALMQRSC
jgi:hypothetical protein